MNTVFSCQKSRAKSALARGAFLGRRLLLLAVVGLASVPVCGAEETQKLFNGRSVDGWHAYLSDHRTALEEVWWVRDGLLICKGQPMGYLYTKEAFTNFRLKLEWRWAPGEKPGNSGLLMRIGGKPQPLPKALEMQLKSGDAGDLYGFHGMKISGAAERLRTAKGEMIGEMSGVGKIQANEKTPGEWNEAEVLLEGGLLQVRVNGLLVNEAKDCEIVAGPIALQSEGGEIHFRKVEITPLP